MSRILIVDDEKWIREGIKVKLKRMGYRPDEMAEASDGIEALAAMKREPYDIVLSDIRMDGMDGLKFCEVLKTDFPETQKVIICGYSEFDYVSKAIELGTVRYLLKPISFEELQKAIQICEEHLENILKYRQSQENMQLEQIYSYGRCYKEVLCNHNAIHSVMSEYRQEDSFAAFSFLIGRHIALSPWSILQILKNGAKSYCLGKNLLLLNRAPSEFMVLCLLKYERSAMYMHEIEQIQKSFEELLEAEALWDFCCGISNPCQWPIQALTEADTAMHHRILYPEIHFINRKQVSQTDDNYQISDTDKVGLVYAVKQKDYTAYSKILQKIQADVQEKQISYEGLERLYQRIRVILEEMDDAGTRNPGENTLIKEIWQYHSINDLFKTLKEWGISKMNLSNSCAVTQKEQMVQCIREYIEEYYYEEITLEQLAKNYFVSSSYVSTAFREIVGSNFQEYLNEIRLTMAKKLLREKKYKIGTIAGMVGFSDQHYFSRIFRKNEGCTPKEYAETGTGGQ